MSKIQALRDKYEKIDDERFFKEVFVDEEYKSALDIKADVVVDVGALAGEFCAYIYPKAKVIYAIEPFPDHYKELVENIQEFNLTKIKPFNIALSDTNDFQSLKTNKARGGHNLSPGEDENLVQTKTLAVFMQEQNIKHIDILKIDIEGGEQYVFGSEDFADVADKISFIIGEHLEGQRDRLKSFGFTSLENDPTAYTKL